MYVSIYLMYKDIILTKIIKNYEIKISGLNVLNLMQKNK